MKKLMMVVAAIALAGCSDSETATKALDGAGYTAIRTDGFALGCGRDDQFSTGFKASGPTGKPVSGVVCSGWMKGATIRMF